MNDDIGKTSDARRRVSWLSLLGPGLLVAATGVGAGDLMTASYAGSRAGLALVWAVVIGAMLKWSLTEGLARWQMATGTTLLEGWSIHLGSWIRWVFLSYFLIWSLMTGAALAKACGVAGDGLLPLGDRDRSQAIWAVVHSLAGLVLVGFGGFKRFERIMTVLTGAMFLCVILSAALLKPDLGALARGLARPTLRPGDLPFALGLLGGVGGTVTLLSYGYWIRESGRSGEEGARQCRIDLGSAYLATAMFGIAMLVISSRIEVDARGADVAIDLADQMARAIGPAGFWIFLAGFWAAVFSSLLGVWQGVPYLFSDFLMLSRRAGRPRDESPGAAPPVAVVDLAKTPAYRAYLVALAIVPLAFLGVSVKQIQLAYAVMGALFMPLLALTLLIMNNRERWIGPRLRNGWVSNLLLGLTLLSFAAVGVVRIVQEFASGPSG